MRHLKPQIVLFSSNQDLNIQNVIVTNLVLMGSKNMEVNMVNFNPLYLLKAERLFHSIFVHFVSQLQRKDFTVGTILTVGVIIDSILSKAFPARRVLLHVFCANLRIL